MVEDFVRDKHDKHSPINNSIYKKDIPLSRNNQDLKPVDQQGKIIIEFCKSASNTILNGRTCQVNTLDTLQKREKCLV